jgi:hypothetical protein
MYVQTGKTFITVLIAIALASGGLAWLSSDHHSSEPTALAQTNQSAAPAGQADSSYEQSANTSSATPSGTGFEDGYKAGYRDGHQDCSSGQYTATARRTHTVRRYAPRARVAGVRYYAAPHRGIRRGMILTIASPAAVKRQRRAVYGGKGAGIGALLGGGGQPCITWSTQKRLACRPP